ncbi:MAG: hypothetical protein MRY83_01845 [Flavobacteriales bacterium]|nr:hypothetical protein [Flavobacteriales bacterium]
MMSKIKKAITIIALSSIVGVMLLYFFGSNKVQTKSELVINKPIDEVWEVMGNQYAYIHKWSSSFSSSKPGGIPKLDGLDYLYRETITARGTTIQELDEFSPENYSLKYHINKGAPEIAKLAHAHWYLQQIGEDKTKVTLEFFLESEGIKGRMLSFLINKKLSSAGDTIAEELKYYLENGKPKNG